MTNEHSSVGITEDIITNIMHLGASEYHLEILVRKYEDMIKFWYMDGNPEFQSTEDVENIQELEAKLQEIESLLLVTTNQRREAMKLLQKQSTDKGNPDLWCLVKHMLTAVITSFEAWQVNLSDVHVKSIFMEQSRLANQVIALFLGYEVTPCSACLTDQLKEDNK